MREKSIHRSVELSVRSLGDSPDDRIRNAIDRSATSTKTLWPSNAATAKFTVRYRSTSDGSPLAGVAVSCTSRPISLTGEEWRKKDNLIAWFEREGGNTKKIREKLKNDIVRLGVKVTPAGAITDSDGVAVFYIEGFHICGNEASPAADEITATGLGQVNRLIITSAFSGLEPLVDDRPHGLTTSGIDGRRYLQPQVIQVLKAIGQLWQRVQGMPHGTPNFITITGASLRWGGLNPPHLAHRFGGSADIRPIGTWEGPVVVTDKQHYSKAGTEKLVELLRKSGASKILFADKLEGVTFDDNHKDHLHVSWLEKPGELEPWDEFPKLCHVPPEFWIVVPSNM